MHDIFHFLPLLSFQIKCHRYWPDDGQLEEYGPMKIHLQSQDTSGDFVVRTFNIQREGLSGEKIVKQFHYTEWPDFGVPSNGESLISFVKMLMKEHQPDVGPMLVHCRLLRYFERRALCNFHM